MEQAEIVSRALWQHKTTQLRVLSYALVGEEGEARAAERTPRDTSMRRPQGPQEASERKGRWNIGQRLSDGSVAATAPRMTPEEEQAQKERALSQLIGLHRVNADLHGKASKTSPVVVESAADPDGDVQRMLDQLGALDQLAAEAQSTPEE